MEEEGFSLHRSQEAEDKNPLQRHVPKDASSEKVIPPAGFLCLPTTPMF